MGRNVRTGSIPVRSTKKEGDLPSFFVLMLPNPRRLTSAPPIRGYFAPRRGPSGTFSPSIVLARRRDQNRYTKPTPFEVEAMPISVAFLVWGDIVALL